MRRRRLVRAPASSANLGPGFDALAAALGVHMELEVEETGGFEVVSELDVPRGRDNLCVRAFEHLHPADGFRFTIRSRIPLAGGLGASAAAIVAGLLAADHLFELDADVLGAARDLEGHPDNVAASLLGGFVVCAGERATRFDVPAGLEAVVAIPAGAALRTAQAREALAAQVPLADAVHNVAHTAELVLGLASGRWDLLAHGLDDRLHQPARAHLYPESIALVGAARELGALGATISGAGPAVLFWTHYEQTGGVAAALRARLGEGATVMRAPFETQGADVAEL